jgi:hypothetical protein
MWCSEKIKIMFNLNSIIMGAIKTMKEVESALPQKKEINYVRALDKDRNPILINKEDLAQVVGELIWKKLRVTNSFAIHYTHQVQWNGVSLNIIGSHNFYNVGVRLATYANKVPSDGIVGEFYSIPSGFTDIKVVYKNWDVYVVFTVVQGQSVYFKYDCSTQCDIIKDIGFIDESYKEIKPIAQ